MIAMIPAMSNARLIRLHSTCQCSLWFKLVVFVSLLSGCGSSPAPSELVQGSKVIQHMMLPKNLSRSSFSVLFEKPKPSEFVSYIFSEMGAAEWPGNSMLDDPEQMRAIGAPMLPSDVAFVSRSPDGSKGKQIVVSFDDAKGVVIVRGYTDPNTEPVLEKQWSLPAAVQAAPGVREMTQSNVQVGMSFQAF